MLNRRQTLVGLMAAGAIASGLPLRASRAAASLKEFRIGYQKGAAMLVVAKQREAFEEGLAKLGVEKVRWVEFQFGPPLLEALGAGAVDIGSVGDTPPIFAQAAGANLVYFASEPAAVAGIVVQKDSAIRSVSDLQGKTVAIAKGSSAHNLAVQALKEFHVPFSAIKPVYLAPADAIAAFSTGQVDAWSIWDPYFAIAEQHHDARAIVTTDDPHLASNSFYLANRDFARNHPGVLEEAIRDLESVSSWASENRGDLARISSQTTGVDIGSQIVASKRAAIGIKPISQKVIEKQQSIADTFYQLRLIPRQIDVSKIVWKPSA